MNSIPRKAVRTISLLVAICLFQVYVLAGATTPSAVPSNANLPASSSVLFGRLMLNGSESILVNGNSAISGTTVISGSQLQTSTAGATLQLASAGKLYIEPNTNLTVTFNNANVDVKIAAGSAFVAVNEGVKSSVTDSNGNASITAGVTQDPVPGDDDDDDKKKAAAIIIPAAIATVVIIYLVARDDDDSGS